MLSQHVDLNRVEKINKNVLAIVTSKNPLECLMTVIKTIKETFKSVARISIFIVNKLMQAYILKG